MTTANVTTAGPPQTEDWIAWRGRVDERLEHMATKADLADLKVWMLKTMITMMITSMIGFGALIVAAIRLLP